MKKEQILPAILALLGIACALVGYLVVYQNFGEKTDTLNSENATLQTEVDELQDMMDHKQEYLDETARMKEDNEFIKEQFPADVKAEDEILFVDATEKAHDAKATAIGMPGIQPVQVANPTPAPVAEESSEDSVDAEDGEVIENTEPQVVAPEVLLFQSPVTVSFTASYESCKDIVKEIIEDETNKKSIENVTMSFDEGTGDLIASMNYSMYSLTGTDKTYTEPDVSSTPIGTDNIFNSAARMNRIEAEKAKNATSNKTEAKSE